ncbi:hypothetical protein MYOV003v1_p0220 [Vibrio phage 207E48.1]|nr:hypothetical protein MYOV003v1_p0220 [Vibrio phage 207E48.1]
MAKEYPKLTHDYLNELTAKWCVNNMNAGLVFVEHKTATSREIPDVLMFRDGGRTTVCFEIKATRSDFLSDKNKPHRINPEQGVGDYRLYVAPVGVIKKSDLPPKWGLLEVTASGRFKKTHVPRNLQCLYGAIKPISGHGKWIKEHLIDIHENMRKPDRKTWMSSPVMALRDVVQQQRWLFTEKNQCHEQRLLFSAMRQQVLASGQAIDFKCSIIFERPFNTPQNDCKHKR